MTSITAPQQAAYVHIQARLIALLLRHDQAAFRRFIAPHTHAPETTDDTLRPYRDLGVLFMLRDTLLDDIVPRIVRRLSFESPRALVVEEPPARGRVNWERTLDATWAERPGEPPLQLHTRQRRRDFATPENLLTVATLLEYAQAVRQLLRGDQAIVGVQAIRHPLADAVERCERELAFPQFAGLRPRAQRIIAGEEGGTAALEAQVAERLIPGGNSAYQELLHWRTQWRALELLRNESSTTPQATLGADPDRDNYLYQIWIFYELADLLHEQGALVEIGTIPGTIHLRFRWGAEGCVYALQHDQGVTDPVGRWQVQPEIKYGVPGVRPDFYLWRVDPPLERVTDGVTTIWREPGVVWDAKYYRPRDQEHAPSSPVKRMIADLALLGEPVGVLLFAFLTEAAESGESGYRLHPRNAQTIAPDQDIRVQQLRPTSAAAASTVRVELLRLLDDAHARLKQPRVPACHGVFLDTLSITTQRALTDRSGATLHETDDLLVCPKPHIGPWRVDLVSRTQHCCRDAHLCHIINQLGARPPVRPPRTSADLLRELDQVFSTTPPDLMTAETVTAVAQQVEQITRWFATVKGAYQRLSYYEQRARDLGAEHALPLLGVHERESLALALFLVEELDGIGASDFSAPAIHLSSVMEVEIKRRVFACPDLTGELANPKRQTLGVLPYLQRNPLDDSEWPRIQRHIAAHWNEQCDPDDPARRIGFNTFIDKAINRVSQLRNHAAHTNPLSRQEYTDLQKIVFQGGRLGYGALNALVVGWHAK